MSDRQVPFVEGEYFHVFNRGNSKQDIFKSVHDYNRFMLLLYLANDTTKYQMRDVVRSDDDPFKIKRDREIVDIHAYCLMPNHYHLVLSSKIENGITRFMQKLGTGYSMYFNRKYERSGSLFEGKFKAKHADTDEYLKYLFSYIHMNPLALKDEVILDGIYRNTEKEFKFLTDYQYSSLFNYMDKNRPQSSILDTQLYRSYLGTTAGVKKELWDWLQYEYAM